MADLWFDLSFIAVSWVPLTHSCMSWIPQDAGAAFLMKLIPLVKICSPGAGTQMPPQRLLSFSVSTAGPSIPLLLLAFSAIVASILSRSGADPGAQLPHHADNRHRDILGGRSSSLLVKVH